MAFSKQQMKQSRKIHQAIELVEKCDYSGALKTLGQPAQGGGTSHYGRYVAGFALLKTGRLLEALVQWGPLMRDGTRTTGFIADSRLLAQEVFSPGVWNTSPWRDLPTKTLEELLAVALFFSIDNDGTRELERHLIDLLWQSKQWESLRRLLNVNNLWTEGKLHLSAKVAFAAGAKAGLKSFAFGSLLMSAGATYLNTHRDWKQEDLDGLLRHLARETFLAFVFDANGARLAEERLFYRLFLELERLALAKILSATSRESQPALSLSPGFFYHHEVPRDLELEFLDWLRAAIDDGELTALYQRNIFSIVQSVCRNQFTPPSPERADQFPFLEFLKEADRFQRALAKSTATDAPGDSAPDTEKTKPLPSLPSSSSLIGTWTAEFCKAAISKSRSLTEADAMTPEPALQVLSGLSRALNDSDLAEGLTCLTLKNASTRIAGGEPWVERLMDASKNLDGSDLVARTQSILERRNECFEFLQSLVTKRKQNKFSISRVTKNEEAFRGHLCLLADTQTLLPPTQQYANPKKTGKRAPPQAPSWRNSMAEPYMMHFYQLLEKSKPLNLGELDNLREDDAVQCQCLECQAHLYHQIPDLAKQLGCTLSITWFENPELPRKLRAEFDLSQDRHQSIFTQEDPFAILRVSPRDSKSEILASVVKMMADRAQDMVRLRMAQNQVFRPEMRFLHGFLKDAHSHSSTLLTQAQDLGTPPTTPATPSARASAVGTIALRSKEEIQ